MKYKAIAFDYDGTLVDTYDFHVAVIGQAVRNCGTDITPEAMEKIVRLSLRGIFDTTLSPERADEGFKALTALYDNPNDAFWAPVTVVNHAQDTLRALRAAGMKTGLVTNSMKKLVDASLAHFGFEGLFDDIQAASGDAYTKEERMVALLEALKVSPGDTLYVGDGSTDIIDAKKVGMDSCLITGPAAWIHGEKQPDLEALAPDFVITDLDELLDIAGLRQG